MDDKIQDVRLTAIWDFGQRWFSKVNLNPQKHFR
jgi:hypothetical protein